MGNKFAAIMAILKSLNLAAIMRKVSNFAVGVLKMQYHLLVVDDDDRIRTLLSKYLEERNYMISTAKNAVEAKDLIKYFEFDLAIIDLMMPGENGIELTSYINKISYQLPVIMLTASGKMEDKIEGLERGAEDYLTKPFEPRELSLRIEKLLNRFKKSRFEVTLAELNYSFITKKLKRNDEIIELSDAEKKLFELLIQRMNEVLDRSFLADCLKISERSVDVQIIRLRNKIENNPKKPDYLITVRNLGYKLVS